MDSGVLGGGDSNSTRRIDSASSIINYSCGDELDFASSNSAVISNGAIDSSITNDRETVGEGVVGGIAITGSCGDEGVCRYRRACTKVKPIRVKQNYSAVAVMLPKIWEGLLSRMLLIATDWVEG